MTHVAAFDLSLTSTGFAASTGDASVLVPPSHASRGIPRLRWIRDAVLERARSADVVVIEGYSYGSKGAAVVNIGEMGGVVRVALVEAGVAYAEVAPAALKAFACGHGNAPKEEMLAAAIRRLGYEGHSHDVADALWLCRMATLRYTSTDLLSALNVKQQQAVASVQWPALEPAAARSEASR